MALTAGAGHERGGAATIRRRPLVLKGATAGWALLAFGGCTAPGSGGVAKPEAPTVTLTYFTDWSGGTRGDWIKAALPKFAEENPGIVVQAEFAQNDAKAEAIANAAAGTLSDTILGGGDVPYALAKAGQLVEVTPTLKTLKFKMEDIIWIASTIQVKGKQYGLPFQWNYWTRVINKTLFKEAGVPLPTEKTTWPQLAESVRRIAKPEQELYGIETGTSLWHWNPIVWSSGGEIISADQRKTLLDTPAAMEGLQFYVDLMYKKGVGTPMDDKGSIPAMAKFASGNMAIGHANAPGKGLDASVGGKFEWDVIYAPLGEKTGKRFVWVSEQPNLVTTTAQRQSRVEPAVRFLIWCCSSRTAQDLLLDIGTGSWPTSKATLNSPKFLAGPPASVKVLVDMIKDFKDPQIFQGWIEWRTALSEGLNPAFANKQSVSAAARDAVRLGDLVLAKYTS